MTLGNRIQTDTVRTPTRYSSALTPAFCCPKINPSCHEQMQACVACDLQLHQRMNIINSFTPIRVLIMPARRFIGLATLVSSCIASFPSVTVGAELFPYAPPSPSQSRSIEQRPPSRAQLSAEDLERIANIAARAQTLNLSKKQQLKQSIRKNLDAAHANGKPNQEAYFTQLLQAID